VNVKETIAVYSENQRKKEIQNVTLLAIKASGTYNWCRVEGGQLGSGQNVLRV
jgi:hypothetical protein